MVKGTSEFPKSIHRIVFNCIPIVQEKSASIVGQKWGFGSNGTENRHKDFSRPGIGRRHAINRQIRCEHLNSIAGMEKVGHLNAALPHAMYLISKFKIYMHNPIQTPILP